MSLYNLKHCDQLCVQVMNSSGERALPGDVYLSKLILSRSSKRDHSYYTRLAVNGKGFQYRGAYLTVLTHTPGGKKLCCLVESYIVPDVIFFSLILCLNVSGPPVIMARHILSLMMNTPWRYGGLVQIYRTSSFRELTTSGPLVWGLQNFMKYHTRTQTCRVL
jgi:hypothetical protein